MFNEFLRGEYQTIKDVLKELAILEEKAKAFDGPKKIKGFFLWIFSLLNMICLAHNV